MDGKRARQRVDGFWDAVIVVTMTREVIASLVGREEWLEYVRVTWLPAWVVIPIAIVALVFIRRSRG